MGCCGSMEMSNSGFRASPCQRLAQMCTAKQLESLRALQHLRTLVYAFDRSLEGALAACGAPLVGYLAQHAFGFKVPHPLPTLSCPCGN